ncbi:MAG: hypothetical protein ACKVS8_03645 [Phycisphaerales bacterium]
MRLLLDNCVDLHAKPLFAGHDVVHVLERGWDGLVNGQLIVTAADGGFQVLVTVDKNLRYQQHLEKLPLSVLELDVLKNRLEELQRMAPFIPKALEHTSRFRFVSIKPDGTIECLAERASAG